MLAVLTNKKNDHAGQRSLSRPLTQARPLEQGQAGRRKAAATAKARLLDPHQAPVADRRPQTADRKRDLAMFNLAIDSKLRGCDVVALKVEDIAPHGYTVERATVRQKKTGVPVRFEVTEQTRQAVDDYIRTAGRKAGEFLFAAPRRPGRGLSTRQYARLVSDWTLQCPLQIARSPILVRRVLAQLLEPPCTDPYARWCGRGGAARLPPIPIFGPLPPNACNAACRSNSYPAPSTSSHFLCDRESVMCCARR
jgi:hypothetical protein